jgi:hypothetical protein
MLNLLAFFAYALTPVTIEADEPEEAECVEFEELDIPRGANATADV